MNFYIVLTLVFTWFAFVVEYTSTWYHWKSTDHDHSQVTGNFKGRYGCSCTQINCDQRYLLLTWLISCHLRMKAFHNVLTKLLYSRKEGLFEHYASF